MLLGIVFCVTMGIILGIEIYRLGFPISKELIGFSLITFLAGLIIFKISHFFSKKRKKLRELEG